MFARKKVQAVLILAIGFMSIPSFADAPYEKYHVPYKDISREVLQNTIGVLTINTGAKKGTTLRIYLRLADRFVPDSLLDISKTIPVSNFGYHPPNNAKRAFEKYDCSSNRRTNVHLVFFMFVSRLNKHEEKKLCYRSERCRMANPGTLDST